MREAPLLSIRPVLSLETADSSVYEQFQNTTLRPILIFQAELLTAIFKNYIEKRKNTFATLSKGQRAAYISHAIKEDFKFKNRLLGVVIGHFTDVEFKVFSENEAELTKRLTALLVQRLQSVAGDLV